MNGHIPSALEIVKEAEKYDNKLDINRLHLKTFELMKKYRKDYYDRKVNLFLSNLRLPNDAKMKIKKELLKPVRVDDKVYSNFMEEVSRRVSQTFQVISGNIAELCVERELVKAGLMLSVNYLKRRERTDIILYYPNLQSQRAKHRIEVKNVKLRERGTRGLAFDGDSLIGFFDDPSEFTESNVRIIDDHCAKTGGYCYVPSYILKQIKNSPRRFKPNVVFAKDMKRFVQTGTI
ncbi:MAG TPA: hypothetical protein VI894_02370 [Candidatus Nanoarchaeia archaeon]|nr:hypothetical protein [Candidatus Nanoarchaeia archaeon]